ncbi:LON peptidase substrate-binding domain-containing protein [Akkermansiaceae bacterium]|nr:LON peptidase substrate-binding domain-containing protein [Akkermansiaceae bacterium]
MPIYTKVNPEPPTELPEECGVMLLTGTALFPHGSMELNIFEKRYREMLAQALEGNWMFAIANLIAPEEDPFQSSVEKIGTLGQISSARTLPDGRSMLVLNGVQAVRFEEWDETSLYPKAKITAVERVPVADTQVSSVKSLILDSAKEHLTHLPKDVQKQIIAELEGQSTITALIDNVSHNFIISPELRQTLMTELNDSKRASQLIAAISS